MPDDYLWKRAGTPDPEIAGLERLLGSYGYREKAGPRQRVAWLTAVAAGLALVGAASLWWSRAPVSEWKLGGRGVVVGETLETGGKTARLDAAQVGRIELEPNSRLRVLASALALQRGTMHAFIWAPPTRFVVETAAARTVDLGCSYTLTVLPDDSGLLTVQTGWVAFQAGAIESFIPAGAACRTRKQRGPGLPYFEDTPPAFREAVERFEMTDGREGLDAMTGSARPRDALTLWHLMVRTRGSDRDRVVQKFAQLVGGADIAGLHAGRADALDEAWNQLGLGETSWWRLWKRNWRKAA